VKSILTQSHCQITAVQTGCNTTAVAKEQLNGHVASSATGEHALMEKAFSVRSVPGLYNED
jgi:hypothetical protein